MSPRAANILWLTTLAIIIVLLFLSAGCAQAPRAIALPSTAAVRAPIVLAKASNQRAVTIAARAEKSGIAAGSADAQALVLATTDTDSQLADALAQVDKLTAQLLAAQSQVDALEKFAASETTRANAAEKALATAEHAKWRAYEIAAGLLFGGLLGIAIAGSQLETILRAEIRFVWRELKKLPGAVVSGVKILLRLAPIAALA